MRPHWSNNLIGGQSMIHVMGHGTLIFRRKTKVDLPKKRKNWSGSGFPHLRYNRMTGPKEMHKTKSVDSFRFSFWLTIFRLQIVFHSGSFLFFYYLEMKNNLKPIFLYKPELNEIFLLQDNVIILLLPKWHGMNTNTQSITRISSLSYHTI